MAATSNKETWQAMRNKLLAVAGGRASVVIGEPRSKMQSGTIAIIPERGSVPEVTLTGPREVHIVTIRRYENALQEKTEDIEFRLDQWRAEIAEDYFGDFDLGGTMAYAEPTQFAWEYGYQTVENTQYRLLDITFAYRTDDRATFAP